MSLSERLATRALHKLMMAWVVPVEGLCMGHSRHTWVILHTNVWQNRRSSNTDIYVVFNSLKWPAGSVVKCASLFNTYLLQHKSLMCAWAQKLNVCGSDLRFFTSHVRGPHHCTAICRANNVLSNDLLEPLDWELHVQTILLVSSDRSSLHYLALCKIHTTPTF